MLWPQMGDKSEPMLTQLTDAYMQHLHWGEVGKPFWWWNQTSLG